MSRSFLNSGTLIVIFSFVQLQAFKSAAYFSRQKWHPSRRRVGVKGERMHGMEEGLNNAITLDFVN
jgi:hypothetical protein